MKYAMDFIEAIEREDKPRKNGLTGVRDPGNEACQKHRCLSNPQVCTRIEVQVHATRCHGSSPMSGFVKKANLYKDNNINVLPRRNHLEEWHFLQGNDGIKHCRMYVVDVGVSRAMEVQSRELRQLLLTQKK